MSVSKMIDDRITKLKSDIYDAGISAGYKHQSEINELDKILPHVQKLEAENKELREALKKNNRPRRRIIINRINL